MKHKRYDAQFKKEIAQLYLSGSITGPSLSEELRLPASTIYKWAEQLQEDTEDAFPGSGNLKPEAEAMKKTQQRIKELENEVAILKHAATYFAKNCRQYTLSYIVIASSIQCRKCVAYLTYLKAVTIIG